MNKKDKSTTSIIGGADGPTSVFIVGRTGKKPLRMRFWNYVHKRKRERAEKKIVPMPHTLKELACYATEKYSAVEVPVAEIKYIEKRKCIKEGIIIKYKPELLGDMVDLKSPTHYDENAVKTLNQQIQARSEKIAGISDEEVPMDFHVYEVKIGEDVLDIEIDYRWDFLAVSYSGGKSGVMKRFQKMAKELYLYYGVTEDDIKDKTERYLSLVSWLSM